MIPQDVAAKLKHGVQLPAFQNGRVTVSFGDCEYLRGSTWDFSEWTLFPLPYLPTGNQARRFANHGHVYSSSARDTEQSSLRRSCMPLVHFLRRMCLCSCSALTRRVWIQRTLPRAGFIKRIHSVGFDACDLDTKVQ